MGAPLRNSAVGVDPCVDLFPPVRNKIGSKNRVGGIGRSWHIVRMTDYDRIAKVIRYIDGHRDEQPDLGTLAGVVGLGSSHFHRLFSSWAGITPKEFLQCLTMQHARRLLEEGNSVLHAALDAGLSGAGRLHDLCVNLEAASPGEIKAGGAGWTLTAGYADTPFGQCLIAESPRGICHLSFGEDWPRIESDWPNADLVRDDVRAGELCGRIFVEGRTLCDRSERPPTLQPLKLFVKGTAFQVKVWRALLGIPEGKLASYGQLAEAVGSPTAPRAVGTAVGSNPIGFLIPCHRVIRSTGAIGGYRWGAERKRAIQAWEWA